MGPAAPVPILSPASCPSSEGTTCSQWKPSSAAARRAAARAAAAPAAEPSRGAGPAAPGRHLRHRLSHLRRQAPLPRISARHGPRTRRRGRRGAGRLGPAARRDVCVVNPYLSCGPCIACRHGKPNCCVRISVLGVHQDGGMAGLLSVPAGNLVRAPGLTLDECATVEFLAIGAHAVRRGAVTEADRVLVVGAGPIGLGVALFARLSGGKRRRARPRRRARCSCRQVDRRRHQPSGRRRGSTALAAFTDWRRLRRRLRRNRQPAVDGEGLRLRRPWRALRAGERRQGRRSPSWTRTSTARK